MYNITRGARKSEKEFVIPLTCGWEAGQGGNNEEEEASRIRKATGGWESGQGDASIPFARSVRPPSTSGSWSSRRRPPPCAGGRQGGRQRRARPGIGGEEPGPAARACPVAAASGYSCTPPPSSASHSPPDSDPLLSDLGEARCAASWPDPPASRTIRCDLLYTFTLK